MITYLWQLPQNILGLLVIWITKAKYTNISGGFWVADNWPDFGVSLGSYIIFGRGPRYIKTVKHEQGHQKQSLYLGPLYLIIIGIPSAIGNLLHRFFKFDYYKQPWEASADKLGDVRR